MYDLIIIGSGPAGYSAGIYARRAKIKTLLLGKEQGGTAALAHQVENYPGFAAISGLALMQKFSSQAEKLGLEMKYTTVTKLKGDTGHWIALTKDGDEYAARALILATGTVRRHLRVSGEEALIGKGVSYCATCDGPLFKNKTVAVVGSGNAGAGAAVMLSAIAKMIYLIDIVEKPAAEAIWLERAKVCSNIKLILPNTVKAINGDKKVTGLSLDRPFQGKRVLAVDGVFVEIGSKPDLTLIKQLGLATDAKDLVKVDANMATSRQGVWAAGDLVGQPDLKQIIVSAAQGATAAVAANRYLQQKAATK